MNHTAFTLLTLAFVIAWMVHLGWTIRQTDEIKFALGIFGTVVSPIGALHGAIIILKGIF